MDKLKIPDETADASDNKAQPVVEVRDLGVFYRRHKRGGFSLKQAIFTGRMFARAPELWALRGVNLTCYEGQTLGIVGHNGAGKSTLCLALSGILTPDEGNVTIRGKVAALLTLGAGLNNELTGRQNILLNAAYLGIPRRQIEAKMEEIIDFSELGDFIDEPIRTYSSGMRSRLAFSVAATIEPEILILDEVLSTGDQAFREKSRKRLKEMMAKCRLIVVVSHLPGFIESTCSHCLWLDSGSVKMLGSSSEVLKAYSKFMSSKR